MSKRPPAQITAYHERVRVQTLAWARGEPYHNDVDNECCPDFSCCQRDMFEADAAKRWEYYRQHHEGGRTAQ